MTDTPKQHLCKCFVTVSDLMKRLEYLNVGLVFDVGNEYRYLSNVHAIWCSPAVTNHDHQELELSSFRESSPHFLAQGPSSCISLGVLAKDDICVRTGKARAVLVNLHHLWHRCDINLSNKG
ncbi:hypothetical protein T265_11169 [Opisthorchis viverrini]|uniref:Uncharacterized protein n=1 Tax=Opisthorchis viverrini TaxID=6198 RepID=A0A074ZYJ8_OPIVI|nr:hypothetical protein T265_11169 [Opisthorchis viverrini]KER20229.1 hypothetical protein T265_11169 [Opisthorchis viverrini]